MEQLVLFEFLGCLKGLFTLYANICLFPSVGKFVILQVIRPGIGLFTVRAAKWLLSSMGPVVFFEILVSFKRFATM